MRKHGKDQQGCMQEDLIEYRMASRKARVVQMACSCQPRNERLQLSFGLFFLKHRMAMLPTLLR